MARWVDAAGGKFEERIAYNFLALGFAMDFAGDEYIAFL